ncbi:Alg9-like mannosyltransferase family-domain-containing protein [Cokeromyces recurvatus]|uniref:Alg9-like mannosyltransferase family-domain-containing protein n=1 Tax=Cokeromyces recurvatus TaxID=90255 RepID=UPI002220768F|nr:Alg9-like mannosyltransferase family-domain-containing protein [Cokeromyces recurvatus]KAI7907627.1 Alg9-like mannosyltransferase family-domain-containing protein [Cokeromyces recurvatus]
MAGPQLRSRAINNKKAKNQTQQAKLAASSTAGDVNAIKAAEAVRNEQNTFSLSLLTAFRVLLIVRCFSALYRILDDCDEVYNYWEPTHYLLQGYGRETWEYSTAYKIRSWAFIFVNALVGLVTKIIASTKLQTFYLIRLFFAGVCSFVEAKFYRTITEEINVHVGHYVFAILFFSVGMFNASTAYLPSTFAMYCVFMAFSYALKPVSDVDATRTYKVVFWIGLGALGGWPFAALIGIPFVIEEVLVFGRDSMVQEDGTVVRSLPTGHWRLRRIIRILEAAIICGAGLTFILVLMDQMIYRQYTVVAWNIIKYNIFGSEGRGPDLYGTEPWYHYIVNGLLNFNIVFILAIGSAVCVLITAYIDRNRIPGSTKLDAIWPYVVLGLKLVPFYLWFIVFSLQAHKEERFMYVAYPLLALNAAISIYLIRSWVYRAATALTSNIHIRINALRYSSIVILVIYGLISISRVLALLTRYRAPFVVYSSIWKEQAPDQLVNRNYIQEDFMNNVDLKLKNVCVGKEWYRFPSQFFLPSDTRIQFLKSNFDGQLPKEFEEDIRVGIYEMEGQEHYYRRRVFGWYGARTAPEGFNDLNKEDPSVYVKEEDCDYLVDVDFPLRSVSELEPRYVRDDKHWETMYCYSFIDAENSNRLLRAFWLPGNPGVAWGDYCMLKRKNLD